MPEAVITQTVLQPTPSDVKSLIFRGNFTEEADFEVHIQVSLKNSDGTENREMTFKLNTSAAQRNHFIADVLAAIPTITAGVENILGVTFV